MLLRFVTLGALGFAGISFADEPDPLLTDARRERPVDARPVPLAAELTRHYDGLKHFGRGRLFERQDKLPDAAQAYAAALRAEPDAVEVMRISIPLQLKLERTVPALRLMRQALARQPNQPDLWLRYAQELLDLQRHTDAIHTVRQALRDADFAASPAFRADLFVVQAAALEALHQHAPAVESYQQALRIIEDRERYLEDPYSPTADELPAERAKLLERLGRAQKNADQFFSAIRTFQEAEAAHPRKDHHLALNTAEVWIAAKRPGEALLHLRPCLDAKPQSDEVYRLYATALRQLGRDADILPALEKLRIDTPGHTALQLVLAEEYTAARRHDEAEILYREIMTLEPVPSKDVCLGYVRLLLTQNKGQQALEDFQGLCRLPRSAAWARTMTLALLGEPQALLGLLEHAAKVELHTPVRLLLLKMALQAHLWPAADMLARQHLAKDPKSAETYLLLAQGLLEQRRYQELATLCQSALQQEILPQRLVFQLELAKAQALTRQAEPALQAIQAAKQLVDADTTDEHKVLCTELYVLHLLGRHADCVTQATALLKTKLANGPWARQVRYILAHAHEALSHFDPALHVLSTILDADPNDDEAAAAKARVLYLQNQHLADAETAIRDAIELDYVAQFKRNKTNPVPTPAQPHAAYQATLGAILLRAGRTQEGVALLTALAGPERRPDPWIAFCLGDAALHQHRRDLAERYWRQALASIDQSPTLGVDLRPSIHARLRSLATPVSTVVPASSSSPLRP